ncbi:MAG: hypothetical protein LBV22_02600, partial [Mycoplasmataceae bacterium]|nr:hypothetical protein [Mycoplasmataceae bacterium]
NNQNSIQYITLNLLMMKRNKRFYLLELGWLITQYSVALGHLLKYNFYSLDEVIELISNTQHRIYYWDKTVGNKNFIILHSMSTTSG